jgi:hypothetical protein
MNEDICLKLGMKMDHEDVYETAFMSIFADMATMRDSDLPEKCQVMQLSNNGSYLWKSSLEDRDLNFSG